MIRTTLFCAAAALGATASCSGQHALWIRQFGTADWEGGAHLAPDDGGGVFAAGSTREALVAPVNGESDVFIARYDAQGRLAWIRQYGTSFGDYALATSRDARGGLFVAGKTVLGFNASEAWLARHDAEGDQQWIVPLAIGPYGDARCVALDGTGGAFAGGNVNGTYGGPYVGASDAWLGRFDEAGGLEWVRQISSPHYDSATGMIPDDAGGVFVSGPTVGDLGGPSAGFFDTWLARYSAQGDQLWITQIGTLANDDPGGIAPDGRGGVYISGTTQGDFGGVWAGRSDAWLARYDGAGNRLWVRQFGTPMWDSASALAADGAGGAFIGGRITTEPSTNAAPQDVWLARHDASGNGIWSRQFGTAEREEYECRLSPDGAGGVFMAGGTEGNLGGPNMGSSDVWIARFVDGCYADCNTDGALTVADFGCFQARFGSGEPYADCTIDGSLTVGDFGCFQTKFVQGCP